MKKCNDCNSMSPDDAVFCQNCGTKFQVTDIKSEQICVKCSMKNPSDAQFCSNCGTSLKKLEAKPNSIPDSTNHTQTASSNKVHVPISTRQTYKSKFSDIADNLYSSFNEFISELDEKERCKLGSWISIILLVLYCIIFENVSGVVNTVLASTSFFCAILIYLGVSNLKRWPYAIAAGLFVIVTLISVFTDVIGYYLIYLVAFIPVVWGLFYKGKYDESNAWYIVLSER